MTNSRYSRNTWL